MCGGRRLDCGLLDCAELLERRGAAGPGEPPAEPADKHKGKHGDYGGGDPGNAPSVALRVVVVVWCQRVLCVSLAAVRYVQRASLLKSCILKQSQEPRCFKAVAGSSSVLGGGLEMS